MDHHSDITIGHYYPKTRLRDASGKSIYIQALADSISEIATAVVYSGRERGTEDPNATETQTVPIDSDLLPDGIERLLPVPVDDDLLSIQLLAAGIRSGLIDHIETTVDVLITHYYLDDIVLSHLLDVPVIYQYHGFSGVGIGGNARERLSKTTTHIANSQATAADVEQRLDRTIDHVVTPGVDIEQFSPDATPAFESDEPVIMYVGRLAAAKGIFDLLKAFSPLADTAQLYVVGDADLQRQQTTHKISQLVQTLQLEADVTFLGEIPHENLHRYYAASDIVCYPTHHDGFGLVNLEAMACGKPVVTTRVDGVEAYATHGENSLLVEPGDQDALTDTLQQLISSPALRERLGTEARETATQYSWDAQARSLVEFCVERYAETTAPAGSSDRLSLDIFNG